MTHNIQLIVLDIDGCLTVGKGHRLDIEEFTRVRAWVDAHPDIPIALCTGRSQPYAEALLQLTGSYYRGVPSIVENGCFLYYSHIDEDFLVPHPLLQGALERFMSIKTEILRAISDSAKHEPGKEVCLSLDPKGDMTVKELYEHVQKIAAPYGDALEITHSAAAVDIMPKGVNKGSALHFLAEKVGIAPTAMVGIGDTVGDLPMLKEVGHVACPANATEDIQAYVKERGGYVARQRDVCGVVEILHHYTDGAHENCCAQKDGNFKN